MLNFAADLLDVAFLMQRRKEVQDPQKSPPPHPSFGKSKTHADLGQEAHLNGVLFSFYLQVFLYEALMANQVQSLTFHIALFLFCLLG